MVTVISIVFNDKKGLVSTIDSVLKQNFLKYEYVIIDGGSVDGTFELIVENSFKFKEKGISFKYISERDNGIYDAMNKGVRLSSNKWLIFLNSGDVFFSNNTLKSIFNNKINDKIEIIYGDSLFVDNNYSFVSKSLEISHIVKLMPFCHQSVFIKRKILIKYPYSLSYSIVSDYHFFLKQFIKGTLFLKIHEIISIHDMSGVSNKNLINAHKEKVKIKKEFKIYKSIIHEFNEHLVFFIKYFIKKLFGSKGVAFIRKKINDNYLNYNSFQI